MVSVDFVELLGAFAGVMAAFAAMVLGFTMHLNRVLREEVLRLIETATKERNKFRQGFKHHDELFREISEKLGDLNGKVDMLIGLQHLIKPSLALRTARRLVPHPHRCLD